MELQLLPRVDQFHCDSFLQTRIDIDVLYLCSLIDEVELKQIPGKERKYFDGCAHYDELNIILIFGYCRKLFQSFHKQNVTG